ncbi:MAG: oligosaccharide flippase family protein [bacterium]
MSNPYRSTILVTIGNLLVKVFAFLATVILMRGLSPARFGHVMTMVTLMSILHVVMDFGSGSTLLKIFPTLKASGMIRDIDDLLSSTLFMRIVIGVPIFFAGVVFSKPLALLLLKNSNLWIVVVMTFAGGLAGSGHQFFQVVFQADEAFWKLVVTQLADAVFKMAGAAVIVYILAGSDVFSGVTVYALAPFLAALMVFVIWGRNIPRPHFIQKSHIDMFLRFNAWYMVSAVSLMIFMNFDLLILAAARPAEEVGYYSSAIRLGSILFLLVQAINTVLMPRVGKITQPDAMLAFYRKSNQRTLLVTLLIIPTIFFGPWLIRWIAGPDYLPATTIWYWVAIDHILQLAFTPMMVVLFGLNRPRFLAMYVVVQMVLNIIGDLMVVSRYGAVGVVIVTLLIRGLLGMIATCQVLYGLKYKSGFMHPIQNQG